MSFEQINSAIARGKKRGGIAVTTKDEVQWLADNVRKVYGF